MEIEKNVQINEKKRIYKNFIDTYKKLSFIMGVNMIYPNPKMVKRHMICFILLLISIAPLSVIILIDAYDCMLRRDILNLIRHSTVLGPFLGGFLKIIVMNYKVHGATRIIDEINRDYESYNNMPPSYQDIVDKSIEENIFCIEYVWTAIVVTCVMTFPLMAISLNIYNQLFKSEPTLYMVHDTNIPFRPPEARFESPAFEILSVYCVYGAILYIVMFIGTGGFFGICVNHGCLKMQLYCKAFEDALKESSEDEMHEKVVAVITEQNKLKSYMEWIQDTFNIWLGIVLIAIMIQLGTCLYQVTEGYGLDVKYVIFMIGTVLYIYLPCQYSSKIQYMSLETASALYSAGWENVTSIKIRRMIVFMIARAQQRIEITAWNLLVFDMDLFVKILKSSYSMYTLIQS